MIKIAGTLDLGLLLAAVQLFENGNYVMLFLCLGASAGLAYAFNEEL